MSKKRWQLTAAASTMAAAVAAGGCGSDTETAGGGEAETESGDEASGSITLYTCQTDVTVETVIDSFEETHPGTAVDLFRAPTGEINARVASDVRTGGLEADVIWACDPLAMQGFVDQGLMQSWKPDNADQIPSEYQTDSAVGAAMLYMITIVRDGTPEPAAWSDLTGGEYTQAVAVPDPALAASAMGTLGYFDQNEQYGLEFYQALADNGAVQVGTPSDVIAGVAQGVHDAGITISKAANQAVDDGSPISVVWPEPGAISIYAPIAVSADTSNDALAKEFTTYVVSREGQEIVVDTGADAALPGLPSGTTVPEDAPIVTPDWEPMFAGAEDLLAAYQEIFGSSG